MSGDVNAKSVQPALPSSVYRYDDDGVEPVLVQWWSAHSGPGNLNVETCNNSFQASKGLVGVTDPVMIE